MAGSGGDLQYCSFNIQVFGQKKMQNVHVVEILLKILAQCDLTLIMEIRDASGNAIKELLEQLRTFSHRKFNIELSDRLGRTNSKEQYGFIYDTNKVQLNASYQYPMEFDQFERPPFSIVVLPSANSTTTNTQQQGLLISGIHTSPKAAVKEINALYNVYQYYFHSADKIKSNVAWLVSGDFNAGCSYVKESDWRYIRLRTDSSFEWLIGDNERTMVKTNCPYDRFVIAKEKFEFKVGNVDVFNFKEEFGISQSLAEEVSDHFPIRMTIRNWIK